MLRAMIGFKERTWRITLYKRELQPDGRVADVEMETFDQARAKGTSADIREANGRLAFLTANGKEVVTGGVAFVAREL
jgi:hypothetical protein